MAYNFPGKIKLIQTKKASSSASLDFTSGITTAYNDYIILINNVFPASAGNALTLLVSTNGGSTYLATGYGGGIESAATDTNSTWANNNSTTSWLIFPNQENNANPPGGVGAIFLYGLTDGSTPTCILHSYNKVNGNARFYNLGGAYTTNVTVNAIRFIYAAGNIASGTFSLYGISK